MASIFKRKQRSPLPEGAVVDLDNRIARWAVGGKQRQAKCSRDGRFILLPPAKDAPWLIAYDDPDTGRRSMVKGFRDLDATREKARKLERDSERRAAGVVDPFEQFIRQPLAESLAEFMAGQTAARAPQIKMQIERIAAGTGAKRLCELDTPAIETWLRLQQQPQKGQGALERPRKALSDTTFNEYVASIRAFTRWALTNRRLPHDPLVGLKRIPAKRMSKKHPRRALTLEQMGALLLAAEQRPERELRTVRTGKHKGQLTAHVRPKVLERARELGRERRLCYLLAFWLRLRREEIRLLEWRDIRLDCLPGRVDLRAETTKAKRADSLPLHSQLREELLKYWRDGQPPTQKVVFAVPDMKAFRADLAAAGIPDRDARGMVDLHALGKSLITAMHSHGVSQRSAQALARHSDPRLTAVTYTDCSLLPLAEELAKVPTIPDPSADAPEPVRLRSTGTENAAPAMGSDQDSTALMQRALLNGTKWGTIVQ